MIPLFDLKKSFGVVLFCCSLQASAQHVQFTSGSTPTWEQCIAELQKLDAGSDIAHLVEAGTTDVGKPLHLFIINKDKIFYPELFDRRKNVLLINNAIHPGEPDGVDACLMLCRELLGENPQLATLLDSTIVCIIPMYNVDGALNRSNSSRANQDGPVEYGFRGNARNLDLNRDFIKCDSKNAQSFNQLFTRIRPNVFVDTHVSNGADYPYTMTLITTQCDKLGGDCAAYLHDYMEPALFSSMKQKGDEMSPYVNTMGRMPETGLVSFLESPRFASGYAALFNSLGFITETHMLKPFAQRVESTYRFLTTLMEYMDQHSTEINRVKREADEMWQHKKSVYLNYELDSASRSSFSFRGYSGEMKPASVGHGQRLYYNHNAPWSKDIPYYKKYTGIQEVRIPRYYVIPQAWAETIDRLQWNGVLVTPLLRDTSFSVSCYYIDDYKTADHPYEGHYLHYDVKVRTEQQTINFYAGDLLVPASQEAVRYIVTVLEPQGEDSFFAWNFFDSVLQQKEWFSDYVFEDKAAELLAKDPELKKQFEDALQSDASLKDNHWNQLYWIYRHSDYYEKSAYRYPVFRLE